MSKADQILIESKHYDPKMYYVASLGPQKSTVGVLVEVDIEVDILKFYLLFRHKTRRSKKMLELQILNRK